jgi:hypothetical protein
MSGRRLRWKVLARDGATMQILLAVSSTGVLLASCPSEAPGARMLLFRHARMLKRRLSCMPALPSRLSLEIPARSW